MKNGLFLVIFVSIASGCSSSKIKTLDTEIDSKGNSSFGTIGIKNDQAIIQKQTLADDELRIQQFRNNQDEDKVTYEWWELKSCREDMADIRLNGNGEIVPLPEIDNMKQPADLKEEFGLNKNGNLQFTTREDFLKRVQIERNYGQTLEKMRKLLVEAKEACERKLGVARVKAGLPARKTLGQSLDQAFQMAKASKP